MRQYGPDRSSENNVQMLVSRNRASIKIISWTKFDFHNGTIHDRDVVTNHLTPDQRMRNTTRGLTPGLIDPSLGEVEGNRVPWPKQIAGAGRHKGLRKRKLIKEEQTDEESISVVRTARSTPPHDDAPINKRLATNSSVSSTLQRPPRAAVIEKLPKDGSGPRAHHKFDGSLSGDNWHVKHSGQDPKATGQKDARHITFMRSATTNLQFNDSFPSNRHMEEFGTPHNRSQPRVNQTSKGFTKMISGTGQEGHSKGQKSRSEPAISAYDVTDAGDPLEYLYTIQNSAVPSVRNSASNGQTVWKNLPQKEAQNPHKSSLLQSSDSKHFAPWRPVKYEGTKSYLVEKDLNLGGKSNAGSRSRPSIKNHWGNLSSIQEPPRLYQTPRSDMSTYATTSVARQRNLNTAVNTPVSHKMSKFKSAPENLATQQHAHVAHAHKGSDMQRPYQAAFSNNATTMHHGGISLEHNPFSTSHQNTSYATMSYPLSYSQFPMNPTFESQAYHNQNGFNTNSMTPFPYHHQGNKNPFQENPATHNQRTHSDMSSNTYQQANTSNQTPMPSNAYQQVDTNHIPIPPNTYQHANPTPLPPNTQNETNPWSSETTNLPLPNESFIDLLNNDIGDANGFYFGPITEDDFSLAPLSQIPNHSNNYGGLF